MKTIAAFMNTNGGKLIIGISDKGEYVGIDKDRLQTNDKFQLFLTNSIRLQILSKSDPLKSSSGEEAISLKGCSYSLPTSITPC